MKHRKVAMILALVSGLAPISGFHKFYLGQRQWGIVYLLLSLFPPTLPIPHIASLFELVWYLLQDSVEFDANFNGGQLSERSDRVDTWTNQASRASEAVKAVEEAVNRLEKLRQDGLISELEFEEKRRVLLDQIR
ncbi:MAG: NINE protein [Prochlorotrichaceae cyanobacterium]|jgi:TM2 domain-containing membrane protein YozV